MPTIKLIYKTGERFGCLGWIAENAPSNFEPGDGRVMAHDILEHLKSNETGWEDELMALGAMIFIRGEHNGYFNADWSNIVERELCECLGYLSGGMTLKQKKASRVSHIEDGIDFALRGALFLMHEEIAHKEVDKESIKAWIRIGYRNARKKYKIGWKALNMFTKIEREVDRMTKFAEEGIHEILVKINFSKYSVKLTLIDNYEEEYEH